MPLATATAALVIVVGSCGDRASRRRCRQRSRPVGRGGPSVRRRQPFSRGAAGRQPARGGRRSCATSSGRRTGVRTRRRAASSGPPTRRRRRPRLRRKPEAVAARGRESGARPPRRQRRRTPRRRPRPRRPPAADGRSGSGRLRPARDETPDPAGDGAIARPRRRWQSGRCRRRRRDRLARSRFAMADRRRRGRADARRRGDLAAAGDRHRHPVRAGAAPAARVCWLVGARGVVLLTTDGATWRRIAFPEPVDLVAVQAADAAHATVITATGRRFSTDRRRPRPGRRQ